MACPYAFMFGKPEIGFHSTRIAGLALYDIIGTIGLAGLTTWWFKIGFVPAFVGWLVVGEFLHYYFGSQTALLTILGINAC